MKDRNNKLRIYISMRFSCVRILKKGDRVGGLQLYYKGEKKETKTFINKLGQYRYKGFKNKAFIYLYS